MQKLEGVEATLLRSDRIRTEKPLFFAYQSGQLTDRQQTVRPYQNSQRNPYFLYQGLGRLPNLLTTHSNVFAVWITVGYFEVEEQVEPTANIPDGYVLGREVGSDIAAGNRHRAFYLIDRSIPVAFEPGVNHNIDRAILIKRFIE